MTGGMQRICHTPAGGTNVIASIRVISGSMAPPVSRQVPFPMLVAYL
jgi:hypothetical protein